ncbi:MAG: prolyl oligopeptidase family serine peptidase [Planctomycetota bacterium]
MTTVQLLQRPCPRSQGCSTYVLRLPPIIDARTGFTLFLHGRGECGDDGAAHLHQGIGPFLTEDTALYHSIVVLPQKLDPDAEWETCLTDITAILDEVNDEHRVAAGTRSLTGYSQGGHGVWTLNEALPGMFDVLAPICGYAEPRFSASQRRYGEPVGAGPTTDRLVAAAASKRVRIFHGARDPKIPAGESTMMASRLQDAAANVTLTIFPEAEHACWNEVYRDPDFASWLEA